MATDQARLAVDTRAFPLLVYDPRKGDTIRERLSLQGNPAVNDDWWVNPKTGQVVDFIDFCRSEGRFAKHFDKDGNPSETLIRARQDRLENWKVLQELAGVLDKKKAPAAKAPATKAPAAQPAKAAPSKSNGNGSHDPLPSSLKVGARIKYNDGRTWVSGVVRSLEPAVLDLDDNTEIEISRDVLREAVALGIVSLQQ
jgi:hypothetical protein